MIVPFADREFGAGGEQSVVGADGPLSEQPLVRRAFDGVFIFHSAFQEGVVGLNHVDSDMPKNGDVNQDAGTRFAVFIPVEDRGVLGLGGHGAVRFDSVVAHVLLNEVGVVLE